ncbi:hypothetical protein R4Y45_02440 [Holzapfeliella sp. He02]|uniref:Prepilin type IV endopeptidase peptidase domain-containing protein n=1 Tax=Holzapfeliella saturejae TaxID=3082953 RepID=A0ABU8SFC5_9LACO
MILISIVSFTLLSWYFIFQPDFKTPDFDLNLKSKYLTLASHLFFALLSTYVIHSIVQFYLLFALLFCSLTDSYKRFIYPIILIPSILIGFCQYEFFAPDLTIGTLTLLALLISVRFKKMGLGDSFIYLAMGVNSSFETANYSLIIACLILVGCHYNNLKSEHPFVPYLVLGFLITLLLDL